MDAKQISEFKRLWPDVKQQLDDSFLNNEFNKKIYKSRLFFARLRLIEKIKGVSKSIIKEAPPVSLLPEIKDGALILPIAEKPKPLSSIRPFRADTAGLTQFGKRQRYQPYEA